MLVVSATSIAQKDSSRKANPQVKANPEVEALLEKAWGTQETRPKKGKLKIEADPRLDKLIEGYQAQKITLGFKVQIYSGRSRTEAIKEKSNFHGKYGESAMAYLIYQPPNFKIRVGNYRDRLKATQALELYKIDFPSAFLVKDEIELEEN